MSRRAANGLFIAILLLSSLAPAFAEDQTATVTLAPIVKEGTPADVLIEDPVLPVDEGVVQLSGGSGGGVGETLSNHVALPVRNIGRPGALSQFRGLGVSATDNNVQALGIPLNGPEGNGFDFSVFPQFMWSNYRLQLGPSMGSLDQRGISGTLTLIPWTEQALVDRRVVSRGTIMASTNSLGQASAAATDGQTYAMLAGFSAGDAEGPSGEASTAFSLGRTRAKLHLLASDVKAAGRTFSPNTPDTTSTTVRIFPVLQLDTEYSSTQALKQSLFYDNAYYHSTDPTLGDLQSRVSQYGAENVFLDDTWKFGASGRYVNYFSSTLSNHNEGVGSFQVSDSLVSANTIIEPTVQLIGVSDFGFYPQASFGAKSEFDAGHVNAFYRLNYNHRFPSLNDRFTSYPGYFIPNPDLGVETDWTGTIGGEWKTSKLLTRLQAYTQRRGDAQVRVDTGGNVFQYRNVGNATVTAILHEATYRIGSVWELSNSITGSWSNIEASGQRIPYLPGVLDVASVGWVPEPIQMRFYARFVSDSQGAFGETLPGYELDDFEVRAAVADKWSISGRVENIADRPVEAITGGQLPGRVFSLLLTAQM